MDRDYKDNYNLQFEFKKKLWMNKNRVSITTSYTNIYNFDF